MPISSLRIANFRNLAMVEIAPCQAGINVLYGINGSGKTSLLESIYYLGTGKSFRSATMGRLIRQSTDKFSLFAQLFGDFSREIPVGVERDLLGNTRIRVAEKDAPSITQLAGLLPIRVINSQSHNLFEAGPAYRRKYLDWGLFYQEDTFLNTWRHFERILKQRNAALKERRPKNELDSWSNELARYGLALDKLRRAYLATLTPIISELAQLLLPLPPLTFHYQPGWDNEMDFATVLANDYPQALRYGHTPYGPHRADLDMTLDGVPVKHYLSRGQQKLLICAMILAQGIALSKYANKSLIYLIDDLPAELDMTSKEKLISLLAKQKAQVFITAIENEMIVDFINKLNVGMKVFHVEHGSVVGQMTE